MQQAGNANNGATIFAMQLSSKMHKHAYIHTLCNGQLIALATTVLKLSNGAVTSVLTHLPIEFYTAISLRCQQQQ